MWTIISQTNCPFCISAAKELDKEGVDYQVLDITDQENYWVRSLLSRAELTTVPQIFNDKGIRVGGYQQLTSYFNNVV